MDLKDIAQLAAQATGLTQEAALTHFIAENGEAVPANNNYANILYSGDVGQFGTLPWHKGARLDHRLPSGMWQLAYDSVESGVAAYAALIASEAMNADIGRAIRMSHDGGSPDPTFTQLVGIVLAPWDGGHYGGDGSSLLAARVSARQLLGVTVTNTPTNQAAAPVQIAPVPTLPITRGVQGAIQVPVTLGGHLLTCILDTGDSVPGLTVSSATADNVGLPTSGTPETVGGVTGSAPAYEVQTAIEIAGQQLDVAVTVEPAHTGLPLLGLPLLEQLGQQFLIDLVGRQVSFGVPVTAPVAGVEALSPADQVVASMHFLGGLYGSTDGTGKAFIHGVADAIRTTAAAAGLGTLAMGQTGYNVLHLLDGRVI